MSFVVTAKGQGKVTLPDMWLMARHAIATTPTGLFQMTNGFVHIAKEPADLLRTGEGPLFSALS